MDKKITYCRDLVNSIISQLKDNGYDDIDLQINNFIDEYIDEIYNNSYQLFKREYKKILNEYNDLNVYDCITDDLIDKIKRFVKIRKELNTFLIDDRIIMSLAFLKNMKINGVYVLDDNTRHKLSAAGFYLVNEQSDYKNNNIKDIVDQNFLTLQDNFRCDPMFECDWQNIEFFQELANTLKPNELEAKYIERNIKYLVKYYVEIVKYLATRCVLNDLISSGERITPEVAKRSIDIVEAAEYFAKKYACIYFMNKHIPSEKLLERVEQITGEYWRYTKKS